MVAQQQYSTGWNVTKRGGYTLALRRNMSHVGALCAVKMMASDEGLSDKHVVYRYEHRAAAAKVTRVKDILLRRQYSVTFHISKLLLFFNSFVPFYEYEFFL